MTYLITIDQSNKEISLEINEKLFDKNEIFQLLKNLKAVKDVSFSKNDANKFIILIDRRFNLDNVKLEIEQILKPRIDEKFNQETQSGSESYLSKGIKIIWKLIKIALIPMVVMLLGVHYCTPQKQKADAIKNAFKYTPSFSVIRMADNSIALNASMINNSKTTGENPKMKIQLFGDSKEDLYLRVENYGFITEWCEGEHYHFFPQYQRPEINLISIFSTNEKFAQKVLYPNNELKFTTFLKCKPCLKKFRFVIAQIDFSFSETITQTHFYLFDTSEIGKPKLVAEANKENGLDSLVKKYLSLCKMKINDSL